jgi:hypothetical protein
MEKVHKKGYERMSDKLTIILTYMLHVAVIARGLTLRWMMRCTHKKIPEYSALILEYLNFSVFFLTNKWALCVLFSFPLVNGRVFI